MEFGKNGKFSNRTLLLCHIQVCSLALNDQVTSRRETWQCNFSACSSIGCGTLGSPITTGLFARKIPAFSKPILRELNLENLYDQYQILVITARSLSTILVASKRPPSPTSKITTSSFACLNKCKADKVLNSK